MIERLLIEDATVLFRNFAGKEGEYNRQGDRNFVVLINPEEAPALVEQGWNIKYLKPREEGEEPAPYLPVAVNYNGPRPPKIVIISSSGRSELDESNVNILDWADIRLVDLVVNPYEWVVNDKSGVKAYLQSMYVTLEENSIEAKYADVPDTVVPVIDPF